MRKLTESLLSIVCLFVLISSCSMQKQIGKQADKTMLSDTGFLPAHVGISLYDPSTHQYLYNYQGDKYFIPASNMKLFTCYEAMKNLGDSLISIWYNEKENGTIEAEANADASFLHPDFKNQPVYNLFKKQNKILLSDDNWKENALGAGWAWDDYNSDYMAERSMMPIYGNLARFTMTSANGFKASPGYFQKKSLEDAVAAAKERFTIRRQFFADSFIVRPSVNRFASADIPFYTPGNKTLLQLLNDTLKNSVELIHTKINHTPTTKKLYSQPTDSLLKIMMHRSDNFFAEQSLLMLSNEILGMMNAGRIIDTLLKTDLAGLPQKPRWMDGSGLSRYNLVSPQDMVWILTQMKNEFSWERITNILPTGGEGTLSGLYKNYEGRIYAKTGTLSNHVALSGYITAKSGRQLIFSVLVNAHQTTASNIRKGVEKFLMGVMDRY